MVTVGGALMAVAALEPSKVPRSVWANTWFDFGFGVMILGVLIATGAVCLHFRDRVSVAEPPKTEVQVPELIVEITGSWFENWKYVAVIAALRVKITNTTGQIIRLRGVGFTHDVEGESGWSITASAEEHLELDRELHARKERQHYGIPLHNYAVVPPHEAISGWVVEAVTRRLSGTPRCTVIVQDTIGNQYEAVLPKREAQTYGS
jgi:hypothetical protein